jgi:hypothetical protein
MKNKSLKQLHNQLSAKLKSGKLDYIERTKVSVAVTKLQELDEIVSRIDLTVEKPLKKKSVVGGEKSSEAEKQQTEVE